MVPAWIRTEAVWHYDSFWAYGENVRNSANQDVTKRCWCWVRHTLNRPANSISRKFVHWNAQGKRSTGGPKHRWGDLETNE